MAQTVLITLSIAGTDTGPFDLYSNVDGYVTPFETGISRASLLAGYTSVVVPDAAFIIRVQSTSIACPNFTDLTIVTSTTTTTSTSSTTTTSTSSTTTTTTTAAPIVTYSYYFADVYACPGCAPTSSTIVAVVNPHTLTVNKFYYQIGTITATECYKITGTGAPAGPYPIMEYTAPSNTCAFACIVA